MVAVVEQTLCHVHSGYAGRLVLESVEYKLVLAYCRNWQGVDVLKRLLHVVGIERCEWSYHAYVLFAERENIGVSSHHYGIVAEEFAYVYVALVAAYYLVCVAILFYLRYGQELLQTFAYAYRT